MPPSQPSRSLAGWALATEREGPDSAAALPAFRACHGLLSSLPIEQQSLNPQGLDALCRVLARNADKVLGFMHSLVISTQGQAPAAAQMAAAEPLVRWVEVI